MGLLRDAIGSALGANQVQNGFNGPKLPFSGTSRSRSRHSDVTTFSPPFRANSSFCADDRYLQPSSVGEEIPVPQEKTQEQMTNTARPFRPGRDTAGQFSEKMMPMTDQEGEAINAELTKSSRPASMVHALPAYELRETYTSSSDTTQLQRHRDETSIYEIDRYSYSTVAQDPGFRPLALPQIAYGEGQPFLRAYSDVLDSHGISEQDFIQTLDAINVAIIPNPEVQIFQKGASIAGWFIPGSASIGLMAGQFGVGIASAFGHASMVAQVLSRANLELFIPKGLEICIGKSRDVDAEAGVLPSSVRQSTLDSAALEAQLASYGDLVAPLSIILPPVHQRGRNDPIAKFGQAIGNRDNQRKLKRANERLAKGKSKRSDALEGDVKWLIVRRATPDAVTHWQETLKESSADLQKEKVEATRLINR